MWRRGDLEACVGGVCGVGGDLGACVGGVCGVVGRKTLARDSGGEFRGGGKCRGLAEGD